LAVATPMRIDIVTLFPEMFAGVFEESILKIARERGILEVHLVNLRDFTLDKHRKVDDRPYGGGPGMVLAPEPVFRCVEHLEAGGAKGSLRVLLTPSGERFRQSTAREFATGPGLILICGHYEGFDERIRLGLGPREVSVGDFVLTGGEIPAMVIVDAVARLLPGVLGDPRSAVEDSFTGDLLDFPQYTRPPEFRGMKVPEVLQSGNHAAIRAWREEQARLLTEERRRFEERSGP